MNMVVIPTMESEKKKYTTIYINLPVDYTEIKQERVRNRKGFAEVKNKKALPR